MKTLAIMLLLASSASASICGPVRVAYRGYSQYVRQSSAEWGRKHSTVRLMPVAIEGSEAGKGYKNYRKVMPKMVRNPYVKDEPDYVLPNKTQVIVFPNGTRLWVN